MSRKKRKKKFKVPNPFDPGHKKIAEQKLLGLYLRHNEQTVKKIEAPDSQIEPYEGDTK